MCSTVLGCSDDSPPATTGTGTTQAGDATTAPGEDSGTQGGGATTAADVADAGSSDTADTTETGTGTGTMVVERVPDWVAVSAMINADDANGEDTRSLFILDIETEDIWVFPLSGMGDGVEGQPMHAALTPDRSTAFLTVGGTDSLSLRLLTFDLQWPDGVPEIAALDTTEVLPAGQGEQQAHGTQVSQDGNYLYFSELQGERVRVFDVAARAFVGDPVEDASLVSPHGAWPNPSGTRTVTTQYAIDADEVALWTRDATTGSIAFDATVQLVDGPDRGAYTHTAAWYDDDLFYTNATQEGNQGMAPNTDASVWLIDAATQLAARAIGPAQLDDPTTGVLEGVSDTVISGDKLYVCEGNVDEQTPPGHLSIWDISTAPEAPVFIQRYSAGSGFPAEFLDCHGLAVTADGAYVLVQSFRSSHLIKLETTTDTVVRTWDAADNFSLPHGVYAQ